MTNDEIIDIFFGETEELSPLAKTILMKVAELAEPAIRRCPPFDEILKVNIKPAKLGYDKATGAEKEELTLWQIARCKANMCGICAFKKEERAELNDLLSKLDRFTAKHRTFSSNINPPRLERFDDLEVVRDVMRARMPEFTYDKELMSFMRSKKMRTKDVLAFSMPFMNDNKIFVLFAGGKTQDSFQCSIGIRKPFFSLRAVAPWLIYPDVFRFHDKATCFEAANTVVDVVDIVLPEFRKKIEKAFDE